MTDAVSAVGTVPGQMMKPEVAGGQGGGAGQASNYDMRDFSAAMTRNTTAVTPDAQVQPTARTEAASQASGGGLQTLLSSFDQLNGGAGKIEQLAKAMSANNGELKPSQIIQLTVASHEFMFQAQLTSNVANRTSDGVQQLFRQQS